MTKMYAVTVIGALRYDPDWADKLVEDVEIVDYACFAGLKISRLSEKLHFTGLNADGWSASFERCLFLEKAEGNFKGAVSYHGCGIKEIGNLVIQNPSSRGIAADFSGCQRLSVARGTFPGAVDFSGSGIDRIGSLLITLPPKGVEVFEGKKASFLNCENLKRWNPKLNPTDFLLPEGLKKKAIAEHLCGLHNQGLELA